MSAYPEHPRYSSERQHPVGFAPDHYLARSWALLTHDRGWIKPVLLLSLVSMIPVVGPLAVLGYALEWGRLTAWGVDSAPKQKNVRVGEVLASGWRGAVVGLVWTAVVFAVFGLLETGLGALGTDWANALVTLVQTVQAIVSLLLSPIIVSAQIRSSLYQRIVPGLRADRVWETARRDLGGLMRMVGMLLLFQLVGLCLAVVLLALVLAVALPYALNLSYGYAGSMLPGTQALVAGLGGVLATLGPALVIFWFLFLVLRVVRQLVVVTGVGLWMRQFDVGSWGRSQDPLPSSEAQGAQRA